MRRAIVENSEALCAASKGAAWYAVYTRSRHERSVEALLRRQQIETYLPMRLDWSRRTDRRKRISVPALPGYLFLRCIMTPEARALIKKSPGVVSLVSSSGQPIRIPNEQIDSLRILLLAGTDVIAQTHFEPGIAVRIRSGPLKGAHGVLVRSNPEKNRLVVQIDQIGMALSAHVHEADVEPLD